MMIDLYEDLTLEERVILMEEQNRVEKKMLIAYLLWWFLGIFGGHRFYLGKIKSGIMIACTFVLGMVMYLVGFVMYVQLKSHGGSVSDGINVMAILIFSVIMLISFLIWWIIDAILLHGKIQKYNDEMRVKLIAEIKRGRIEN